MMLTVGTDDHGNIGCDVVLVGLASTQHKYRFFALKIADDSKTEVNSYKKLKLDEVELKRLDWI